MRLHTKLDHMDVAAAMERAKQAGHVSRDVMFMTFEPHKSRTHPQAFELRLGSWDWRLPEGTKDRTGRNMPRRRPLNTRDRSTYAATWHEWGWFMAQVFWADPDARFGDLKDWHYAGYADFMDKTEDAFDLEPSPEKRRKA